MQLDVEEKAVKNARYYFSAFVMAACGVSVGVNSGEVSPDLKDGISEYKDDAHKKYDELGDPDLNVKFIKMNARAKADGKQSAIVSGTTGGGSQGNINSAVIGPGSTVRGDIIIIDESRGGKTQVVQ